MHDDHAENHWCVRAAAYDVITGLGKLSTSMASAIIAFICIYIAGFAWSWGPLGWLVPSEIQPL